MVDIATLPAGPLGNIYRRPFSLTPDSPVMHGHAHKFDHVTFVWDTPVEVKVEWPNGGLLQQIFEKGQHFLTRAGCQHEIKAAQPSYEEVRASYAALSRDELLHILAMIKSAPPRLDCVYAHRAPQGEVLQQSVGWREAYE